MRIGLAETMALRFDDMLATVLARQPDRLAARVSQWRQILDLLAQQRAGDDDALGRDAFARLDSLRSDVPVTIRRETARAVAGRPVPAPLVAFLAADVPQVAGEILQDVRLDDDQWLSILPALSPTGRGFLRHRRDLGRPVKSALAGFGSSDFALTLQPLETRDHWAEPEPVLSLVPRFPAPASFEQPAAIGQADNAVSDAAPSAVVLQKPRVELPPLEAIDEPAKASMPAPDPLADMPSVDESSRPDAVDAPVEEAADAELSVADETLPEPGPDPLPDAEEPEAMIAAPENAGGHEEIEPSIDAPEPAESREPVAAIHADPGDGMTADVFPIGVMRPDHAADTLPPLPDALDLVPTHEPGAGEGQIRAIISRIARFRLGRGEAPPAIDTRGEGDLFHFEAGPDGIICWVEGVPRGPIIGETIAMPAHGPYGVDAQAPGAFRRRAVFRDARLLVAGSGPAGGEWRIAGVPVFAPADGRFLGYRGTARRPRTDERAEAASADLPVAAAADPALDDMMTGGLSPDSLRQLVHELRTPLNAIGGFAEMIRRQMRGPVSGTYRERAQKIAEQASQLLTAVDDLDVAARLDGQRLDLQRAPVDLAMLLGAVCDDNADLVKSRGALFARDIAADLPPAIGDAAAYRRMIARLVASATALAEPGESIEARLGTDDGAMLALVVSRPHRLDDVAETDLLDPGYGPEGDWPDAPLLGLGFSLHLVRRLAAAAGGALLIDDDRFTLRLPTAGTIDDPLA